MIDFKIRLTNKCLIYIYFKFKFISQAWCEIFIFCMLIFLYEIELLDELIVDWLTFYRGTLLEITSGSCWLLSSKKNIASSVSLVRYKNVHKNIAKTVNNVNNTNKVFYWMILLLKLSLKFRISVYTFFLHNQGFLYVCNC